MVRTAKVVKIAKMGTKGYDGIRIGVIIALTTLVIVSILYTLKNMFVQKTTPDQTQRTNADKVVVAPSPPINVSVGVERVVSVPYARVAEKARCGEYKQIGLLVGKDDIEPPVMLPLFGRKMTHRDRYEYYTATDKEHLWKVPVQFEHRDCQDEVGCGEIYEGVDVIVPDYANKTFRARIYKNVVVC